MKGRLLPCIIGCLSEEDLTAHRGFVLLSEQQGPAGENGPLKHQLLRVIVRVAQYRMILTGETQLHQGLH